MEVKKIGKTDMYISEIGFGGLSIAGFHYGKTKDKESIEAIKEALELGINFFDTADIYGFGKSEIILSEGLAENREKVIIATKVGLRWNKKKEKSYCDLSPGYIFEAALNSLFNLNIKKIPLYQIHYPDPKIPAKEIMEALNKLKEEGKIQHIGCSNFTKSDIDKYQKFGRIESIQIGYNLLDQSAEKIFKACKKWDMSVIAYSPLAQGLLTGKYQKTKFGKNDRRKKSKYFSPKVLKKIKPLLEKMKEIGEKYQKTLAQVALRWILDNSNITCIIIGAKTASEIKEAAGASGWKLAKKERDELTKLGKRVMI